MRILLIGSGGREHALAWKITQSSLCEKLFIAPGNAGTGLLGENVKLNPDDFEGIAGFIDKNKIDMLVVGPEDPLVKGIADFFLNHPTLKHVQVIGPGASGARLEGSKEFSKEFMKRHGIPTARFKSFTPQTLREGKEFLKSLSPPYVIKASGLAAGKGVIIIDNLIDAEKELTEMLGGKFGSAGNVVVIEEFLKGRECSVFILTDGNHYLLLPEAKDYKRIGEGDTGLNTGGMGAVSPVPFCTPDFMEKVSTKIIRPTLEGLIKEEIPYRGFIFFGLMEVQGEPFVIEYNCRMGDPETEVVMPRIQNDIVELFSAVSSSQLNNIHIRLDRRTAVTVMCVSGGYPGDYEKGLEIKGLENNKEDMIFHAGTWSDDSKIITSGGRVLAFTSISNHPEQAIKNSYKAIQKVSFPNMYYRKDIGRDLLDSELN